MQPADFLSAVEVGERARHPEHAVIAACGEMHGLGRIAQQLLARGIRLGDRLEPSFARMPPPVSAAMPVE